LLFSGHFYLVALIYLFSHLVNHIMKQYVITSGTLS